MVAYQYVSVSALCAHIKFVYQKKGISLLDCVSFFLFHTESSQQS